MKKVFLILILICLYQILLFANDDIIIYIKLPNEIDFDFKHVNPDGTLNFVLQDGCKKEYNELDYIKIEGFCSGLETDSIVNINNINVLLNIPFENLRFLLQANNNACIIPHCSATSMVFDGNTDTCQTYRFNSSNGYVAYSNIKEYESDQLLQIRIVEKEFIEALIKGNKTMSKKRRTKERLHLKNFLDPEYNNRIINTIEIKVKAKFKFLEPYSIQLNKN